jgi:catechol 2,3-dioxygenase-like lactoylglutathione lyase family enzyme
MEQQKHNQERKPMTAVSNLLQSEPLQVRNSWIVMSVADADQALELYRDKLGIPFDLVVEDESGQVVHIGSPLNIHFTTGQPHLYLVIEGIEEVYASCQSKSVNIIDELKFNPHTGMDEFAIQDDDGNVIRFGRDVPEE